MEIWTKAQMNIILTYRKLWYPKSSNIFLWNGNWWKTHCEDLYLFSVTIIRKNVQNYYSEFEGLLHKMVSQRPFIIQEICHINFYGERSICNISTYIKEFLSKVEIENKICQRCSKLKAPVEIISDKLIMYLEGLQPSN